MEIACVRVLHLPSELLVTSCSYDIFPVGQPSWFCLKEMLLVDCTGCNVTHHVCLASCRQGTVLSTVFTTASCHNLLQNHVKNRSKIHDESTRIRSAWQKYYYSAFDLVDQFHCDMETWCGEALFGHSLDWPHHCIFVLFVVFGIFDVYIYLTPHQEFYCAQLQDIVSAT